MTRAEEIKALAEFFKWDCLNKPVDYCEDSNCDVCRATALVDAGWRKQIEAEWRREDHGFYREYRCSHCENLSAARYYYCPECGAKMKGVK